MSAEKTSNVADQFHFHPEGYLEMVRAEVPAATEFFFREEPVRSFADAKSSDAALFKRFFHAAFDATARATT